ncbi:neprilysin-11-like [Athalia rosae]|uniref:neprilysin-11-like n=1 Tax=Athalia rosae TaxID=37344 RepID=UPI002033ED8C|nr:neprilysin-11-like [Athalia rosae]
MSRWIFTYTFIQLLFLIRADNEFHYVDQSVQPCDNFYKFACGNFENIHPVPETFTSWDGFVRLQKEVDERLKNLLEGDKTQGDSKFFMKAQEMYAGCMDSKTRDKKGISPMYSELKGWPNKFNASARTKVTSADWQRMANFVANFGIQFIFKLTIRADVLNATRTSIYIEQDDLALPASLLSKPVQILDNNFSSRTNSDFILYLAKIMEALRNHSRSSLSDKDILATAKSVNEFMTSLTDAMNLDYGADQTAAASIPSAGTTTVGKLQAWTDEILVNFSDSINWKTYLQTAFKKSGVKITADTQIFITNRKVLRNLLIYVHDSAKELLDDFIFSRLASFMAPETSSDLYELSINFYTKRGYIPPNYPKWKYCLHKVVDFPKIGLSFAVAQKYRDIYISEKTVERATQMIENLRDALEELIVEAEWMDDFTKNYAIYKLKSILILTGGPDSMKTKQEVHRYYKKLRIYKNDHHGNINRLRSFNQAKNFAEVGKPRNRNIWTQSPLIVNAYYNGLNNRILFPISTMREPLFSENVTSLLDYARIGSVMAHELTHAFDSEGRLLDAEGSLGSWWSQLTARIYADKTKCFVNQYNKYVVADSNFTVNGEYTLPENIADNVGLRAALRAFKNDMKKNIPLNAGSSSNHYTEDQKFYLSFASIWCHVGALTTSDKHAPYEYRVRGPIQNMEHFYATWRCQRRVNRQQTISASSNSKGNDICILW